MLKSFLQIVFGRRDDPPSPSPTPSPQPSRWREAPNRTLVDDVGGGIVVTTTISTGHHGFVAVVGESHYQDALRALVERLGSNGIFAARLVPEPANIHDANVVAVCVDDDLAKIGYLARGVAKSYHTSLVRFGEPVVCPARLTGVDGGTIRAVLDFEPVRKVLGLPSVSIDQGDMDCDAAAEYHRLNNANRIFVKETRSLEESDPLEAVARYRRALITLAECRELARLKGLETYGFKLNQTDATPIDRLTRCLVTMGKTEEAARELDKFVDEFPHAREMTMLKAVTERIQRAASRSSKAGKP